jgi:hypothetical protein
MDIAAVNLVTGVRRTAARGQEPGQDEDEEEGLRTHEPDLR